MGLEGSVTSYDYGAAIQENRQLAEPKYSELKLLSLFVRSASELPHTKVVATSRGVITDTSEITVTELENPKTQARFYVVRHSDSSSRQTTDFRMSIRTSRGLYQVPIQTGTSLSLNGRVST
jgi:beta-galactosidase